MHYYEQSSNDPNNLRRKLWLSEKHVLGLQIGDGHHDLETGLKHKSGKVLTQVRVGEY